MITSVIQLLQSIVAIFHHLYSLFSGEEPLVENLRSLLKKPRARYIAGPLCAGITFLLLWLVLPQDRIVELNRVGAPSRHVYEALQPMELTVRYDPDKSAFVQDHLLSASEFPTAVAVATTRETTTFYVGTYGAGLFASDSIPEWRSWGLGRMLISQILLPMDRDCLMAATSLGIFVTCDRGNTWEHKGPIRDIVTAMAVNPENSSVVLAGTLNGLYRSNDGGETWLGPMMEDESATAIRFSDTNPRRVYMSLLGGEIRRSDDGGNTWMIVRQSDGRGSAPLALGATSPDVVYLGPSDLGLYRTDNAGRSWEYLGLRGRSISSIVVSTARKDVLFVGTDDGHGVFTSFDGGKTWQNHGSLRDQVIELAESTSHPGTIIATTRRNGLMTSGDFGRTWFRMGLEPPTVGGRASVRDMIISPHDQDRMVAILRFRTGIFESVTGGARWSSPDHFFEFDHLTFEKISSDPRNPDRIALSARGGAVVESKDGGQTWSLISENLPSTGYAAIAFADKDVIYAGPSDRGVWRKSSDENEWLPTSLGSYSIREIWTNEAGTTVCAFDEAGGFHFSTDGGANWTTSPHRFRSVAVDPSDVSLVIGVSHENRILRSRDTGESWSMIGEVSTTASVLGPRVVSSHGHPTTFYVTSERVLRVSFDLGESWLESTLPDSGLLFPSKRGRLYLSTLDALYESNDSGQTWAVVDSAATPRTLIQVVSLNEDLLLARTERDGIHGSTDSGQTWKQTSIGPELRVLDLVTVQSSYGRTALAIAERQHEVVLLDSDDGVLWQVTPLPCEGTAGYLGALIDAQGGTTWQVHCEAPPTVVVIEASSLRSYHIQAPSGAQVHSARVESETAALLLTGSRWEVTGQDLRVTEDGGRTWLTPRALPTATTVELCSDLRSEAALLTYEGTQIVASYRPRTTTSLVTRSSRFLYALMSLMLVVWPDVRKSVWEDFQRVLLWTFRSTQSRGYPRASSSRLITGQGDAKDEAALALRVAESELGTPFLLIGTLTMVITGLLLVELAPAESVIITALSQVSRHVTVRLPELALLRLPLSLTTSDGYRFLAVLVAATFWLGLVVILVSSAGAITSRVTGGRRGCNPPGLLVTMKQSTPTIVLGALAMSFLSVIPASPAHRRALLGSDIGLLVAGLQFFFFYRAVTIALDFVAQNRAVSRMWLALVYLGQVLLLFVPPLLMLPTVSADLGGAVRLVASNIGLDTFAFLNALLVILYIFRGD